MADYLRDHSKVTLLNGYIQTIVVVAVSHCHVSAVLQQGTNRLNTAWHTGLQ